MSVAEGLVALLRASSSVTALVGKRIYPMRLPKDTKLPAIAYQRIFTERVHSHQGYSNLEIPNFDVRCWGIDYTAAESLADVVETALDGYQGAIAGHEVYEILVEGRFDLEHIDDTDPNSRECAVVLSVSIAQKEA
jgi:hypothetical protein